MGKKKKERELTKGEKSPALFAQPDPKSDKPDVWPLVIKDMADRDHLGKVKYGIPLRSHNGRDPLVDAYQEVLDLSVYLRQEIEERKDLKDAVAVARRISGFEHAGSNDIASLLEFLINHIEQQKRQIQIMSATLIHYQTQASFIAGYDHGVETAVGILEKIKGESLPADQVMRLLDEATSRRENASAD